MDDFIDPLLRQIDSEASIIRRREADEERERQELEKFELDRLHDVEVATQKARAERKTTLDMAWAAAELLNDAGVQPNYWLYTQRKKFFQRRANQGISAVGWPLIAWRNTRYAPTMTHNLILTPTDDARPGVHLSYFDQRHYHNDTPPPDITPDAVHPLSLTPTDEDDMDWPRSWKTLDKTTRLMEVNEIDLFKEAQEIFFETHRSDAPIPDFIKEHKHRIRSIRYNHTGSEKIIRSAIAQLAARHLVIAPEKAAKTIQSRIRMGLE